MALKDKLMTLEDFKAVRDVDVASNSAQFTEIKADLSDIDNIVTDVVEQEKSALTGTKITAKTINGSAVVVEASTNYYVMSFDVAEGDKLLISGAASNNGYLYIFTDSNDTSIAHYPTKNTYGGLMNYSDIEATAPQGAVKLIVASHSSVSYTQAKADKITGYRVIGLDEFGNELGNEVDEISQRVTVVEQDIDGNKAKVNSIFEYSVKTETGEMIGAFSELSGLNIENANSAIIRSAQIFEPLYSGGSAAGVTITKNNDGTYTLNGTATGSAGFYLNQSTRTGHDKLVQMDGNYSCRLEILSGKASTLPETFGRFIIADYYDGALHNVNDLSMWLTDYDNVIENKSTGGTINAIISFHTVLNCTYDNLTFRISVNKGEKVLDTDSEYVEPITITDMSSALEKAKKCLPYIWITTTPNTATITAIGKTVKGVETSEPVELYSVLAKYNDRVDTLAQLFGRQLFLVYTDIHASIENLQRINTWAEKNKTSVYVSDTYCLGDMLYDHPGDDKPITAFDNVPIWGKTLKVIGNHDVGTGSSEITAKQTYDTYIKPYVSDWGVVQPSDAETDGKSYYYKDYAGKVRIIVLDIYHYDTAQSTWFETVLESARTNNLAVIVAQHADICTALEKAPLNSEYPFARKYNGYTGLQYSLNYVSERTSVDSFIENGGTFICWLTGHMHVDMTGTYTGEHGKQLSIVLSNSSLGIQSSIRINNYSQDCFTYLAVDTDLHYLYLVRIGEAVDKWYHQNLFMCYDYVNHSVVEYH